MLGSRPSRATVVGIGTGLVAYLAALWDLGVRPLRTIHNGAFAHFFDLQARALLHGHLDVPPGSLGIEEFVVRGRSYMYFPPFPALLRLPILVVTDRFDGRLTALSMLAGWGVLAGCAAALVWRIRRLVVGDRPVSRTDAALVALVLALTTGGAPMTFLASRPFVFHEVYVWSVALVLAVALSVLRAVECPSLPRLITVAVLTAALVLTRTPAGWVMAVAIVAIAVWIRVSRRFGDRSRFAGRVMTAGAVAAVVIGGSVNWVKFHHAYRFPIDLQVWSRINPARQATLAANDGRLDGIRFIWSTLTAYFRPDGIRFTAYPPFVSLPARPPTAVGGVTLDQTYRTASITAVTLLLFAGAVWGLVVLCRRRRDDGLDPMRFLLGGAIVTTGPVLAFSYIAFRYTAEFVPALFLGSAVAAADVGRRVDGASRIARRLGAATIGAAGVLGIVAGWAIGVGEARMASGGPRLEALVAARDAFGGGHLVRPVAELPAAGSADEVAVVGECDAVYVGTGNPDDPWRVLAVRGLEVRLTANGHAEPGSATIVRFRAAPQLERSLEIERRSDGRLALLVRADDGVVATDPVDLGDGLDVSVVSDGAVGGLRVRAADVLETFEPLVVPDAAGVAHHVRLEGPRGDDLEALALLGIEAEVDARDDMGFCERLLG